MNVVGKNIVWLLVSQAATWVLTFATLIVVPDLLGVDDFGALSFATIFVTYFSTLAGLESGPVVTRSVARDPNALPTLLWNSLLLRLVSVVVFAAAALGLAVLLGFSDLVVALIAIGCLGMFAGNINHVITTALAGVHRLARPAMWATVQLYVGGVLGIVIVIAGGGAVAYAAIAALATLIPLAANWRGVRPFAAGPKHIDRRIIRNLVTGSLPLLLLTALTQFYGNVDYAMLEWLGGKTALGWYSIAYRWAAIPFFICTAVVAAYFPRFSELAHREPREFAGAVNRALMLVVIVSAPFAAGLVAVASDLIELFYDDDFLPAIPVLQILALQVPITAVDTVLGTALIASDRVRRYLVVAGVAAVMTPIALYITINAFADGRSHGAVGAALITTLTEVFVLIGAYRFRAPGVLDLPTISRCVRALAAGAIMWGVLQLVAEWSMFVRIPLGAAIYGVAAIGLRVVRPAELVEGVRGVISTVRRRTSPSEGDDAADGSDPAG